MSDEFVKLICEFAFLLIKESKPIDENFSKIVDREFWNLLA
jgi:hypothetical protein